ncbi:NUMOD1 domain-containing DNA-binding protein [Paracoccus sp. SM22M-07]|uniref:NUMOD1 domain-containing DNA-binding protein n=1 Tax=Paracoccus sp. SM22M-07 TaxID=1520813 RepID=UPI000914EEC5|nr:NUMOD1 domain-containing DNA-binding protein [Paracoccus sp. SM22M-07]OJH45174.1 hypothetical protein IE00_05790 [Paracoccus sp. SM22M-07]
MPKHVPVTGPDGTHYPTLKAAAVALGVNVCTIRYHLGKYGNLNLINTWSVPVFYRGKAYASIKDCADAHGFARHTLSYHLQAHGNLDKLGAGKGHGNPGNAGNRKATRIGPMQFDRRRDAADALGVNIGTLRRWLAKDATPRQRAALAEAAMIAGHKREVRA